MTSRYHAAYGEWRADPQAFWARAAEGVDWVRPPKVIFDAKAGVYGRWFPDATCNACFNAVDRHVATRGDQAAILYDSPVTGAKRRITYAELQDEVATLAAALVELGVEKGDRVIVYMPMIPEAIFAMLACARIGAVHSVVFGGFAAKELATRIDDAEPKLVLTASCGVEAARIVEYKPLLDHAIELAAHKPRACVVFQRPQRARRDGRGARPRLGDAGRRDPRRGKTRALRRTRRHRPALYSLHLGHDRDAQGRGARHRRLSRRAEMVDDEPLWRRAGRDLLDRFRHRLGGRPFLHRLCAAAAWLRQRAL